MSVFPKTHSAYDGGAKKYRKQKFSNIERFYCFIMNDNILSNEDDNIKMLKQVKKLSS